MKRVVTHSGDFHADDIFAVATLSILLDGDIDVIRTRNPETIEGADYVVDVGGAYDPDKKRFDHHQKGGAGERENGIPYAAFGLVWKEYGEKLGGSTEAQEHIDLHFVQGIDAPDNGVDISKPLFEGVFPASMHSIIQAFRPTWKEEAGEEIYLERFLEFLGLAKVFLSRLIVSTNDYLEAQSKVVEAYEKSEDKRVVVLENKYPWHQTISSYDEPIYVVYPRTDGNWGLQAVRKDVASFENKKDLPSAWAGKNGEELREVTGVSDAVFAHNKRFFAVAETKEGALELAHIALES